MSDGGWAISSLPLAWGRSDGTVRITTPHYVPEIRLVFSGCKSWSEESQAPEPKFVKRESTFEPHSPEPIGTAEAKALNAPKDERADSFGNHRTATSI